MTKGDENTDRSYNDGVESETGNAGETLSAHKNEQTTYSVVDRNDENVYSYQDNSNNGHYNEHGQYEGDAMKREIPPNAHVRPIYEVPKFVPKVEIREMIREVPNIEIEIVEKVVEIPDITYVDKFKEVEDVREVIKHVPRVETVEVPVETVEYRPVIQEQTVEKIIEIPSTTNIIYQPQYSPLEVASVVPRYMDRHVTVVASEEKNVVLEEGHADMPFFEVKAFKYTPYIVPVDVYVPRPVVVPVEKVVDSFITSEAGHAATQQNAGFFSGGMCACEVDNVDKARVEMMHEKQMDLSHIVRHTPHEPSKQELTNPYVLTHTSSADCEPVTLPPQTLEQLMMELNPHLADLDQFNILQKNKFEGACDRAKKQAEKYQITAAEPIHMPVMTIEEQTNGCAGGVVQDQLPSFRSQDGQKV